MTNFVKVRKIQPKGKTSKQQVTGSITEETRIYVVARQMTLFQKRHIGKISHTFPGKINSVFFPPKVVY